MRMSSWPFSELDYHKNFKRERDKGIERGFLQVHGRKREIQLLLLHDFIILSND
jgi:hypothetical protein